jgi:hypothetical protein
VVAEVVFADRRGGGGSVACCDAYYDDENGDVDGGETCPRAISSLLVLFSPEAFH